MTRRCRCGRRSHPLYQGQCEDCWVRQHCPPDEPRRRLAYRMVMEIRRKQHRHTDLTYREPVPEEVDGYLSQAPKGIEA